MRLGSGLIATNWHVMSTAITIEVEQGSRSWPASVVRCDQEQDLCLLRAAVSARAGAALQTNPPPPGEPVFAVGAPEGINLVIAQGLAAGLRPVRARTMLVAAVATSAGSSGSGLFDIHGNLLGLVADQIANGQDLTLAVPASAISALLHAPSVR